jgi:hypothetical protein
MIRGISVAVWVPLGALGIAMIASGNPLTSAVSGTGVWMAAGVVGVAGVICGTILALRLQPASSSSNSSDFPSQKPARTTDEFDIAGHRG